MGVWGENLSGICGRGIIVAFWSNCVHFPGIWVVSNLSALCWRPWQGTQWACNHDTNFPPSNKGVGHQNKCISISCHLYFMKLFKLCWWQMNAKLNALPRDRSYNIPSWRRGFRNSSCKQKHGNNRHADVSGALAVSRLELQLNKQDCFWEKRTNPRFGKGETHKGIFSEQCQLTAKEQNTFYWEIAGWAWGWFFPTLSKLNCICLCHWAEISKQAAALRSIQDVFMFFISCVSR